MNKVETLLFPKVMMVSDEPITKDNPGSKRVVWAYNTFYTYPYITYPHYIQKIEDVKTAEGWKTGVPGGGSVEIRRRVYRTNY